MVLTARFRQEDQRAIRRQAILVSVGILLLFSITGLRALQFLGITLPAFQIAGGLLLVVLGLEELNVRRTRMESEEQHESLERDNIAIFPLGTPLIAGPGAISVVILYSSKAAGVFDKLVLVVAILSVSMIVYLCMVSAPLLYRILGRTGLNLLTRLMGILITAVGIQFILNGLDGVLKGYGLL
jgi:multiple antibiotic resistance protein